MLNGILIIDKKKGISSHDVVYKIRKKLSIKKVGHAGTLDLEASGLLTICIGKATKISDYLMNSRKEYIADLIFGVETDTEDISGNILFRDNKLINFLEFYEAINRFIGTVTMIPPMYSALKINGKKLYEIAREGKVIDRKPRDVNIYNIDILYYEFPRAKIKISCSKGTYIRTLIKDIGRYLNTYATMTDLKRTKVGKFNIENSIPSDKILDMDYSHIYSNIISIDEGLYNLKEIILEDKYFDKIINGVSVNTLCINDKVQNIDGDFKIYCKNKFIGIGNMYNNFIKVKKVFYEKN